MTPLPNAVQLVGAYLRGLPEVQALAGQRVFTGGFPKQIPQRAPFVLVQRIGGLPVLARPLVVDLAVCQLDAYGGDWSDAYALAAACRDALADLSGEQPNDTGNVCGVVVGALRDVPDETWKPPRARWISDLEVTVKPAGAALAATGTA